MTWVFPKIGGKTPNGLLKIMENPINKWMIWGVFNHPYFWFNTHIKKPFLVKKHPIPHQVALPSHRQQPTPVNHQPFLVTWQAWVKSKTNVRLSRSAAPGVLTENTMPIAFAKRVLHDTSFERWIPFLTPAVANFWVKKLKLLVLHETDTSSNFNRMRWGPKHLIYLAPAILVFSILTLRSTQSLSSNAEAKPQKALDLWDATACCQDLYKAMAAKPRDTMRWSIGIVT